MSRAVRYHKREYEKAAAAASKVSAHDSGEDRATMAEAFAHSDRLHQIAVKALDAGKAGMAVLEIQNKILEAHLAASEKVAAAYKHLTEAQTKKLDIQKALLTRARHLEAHVELRSLGRPVMRGARLPGLSNSELTHWLMMEWNPTPAQRQEIYDLEHCFDSDARFLFDHRWPCIDSFLDGETIPPIPCDVSPPSRDRDRSPRRCNSPYIPSFLRESSSDSDSQGFEIVPVKGRLVATQVKLESVGYPTPTSTA